MFMFLFLLRFINSTISFEKVLELLRNVSPCVQVLDVGGIGTNWSKCFKCFMIHSCSSIGIYSSFTDISRIIVIWKIGFLFTCDSYLSNFAFITMYAPLRTIDCSMFIGLPTTSWQGLSKTTIDVVNWFNNKSKIEVTLANARDFDLKISRSPIKNQKVHLQTS